MAKKSKALEYIKHLDVMENAPKLMGHAFNRLIGPFFPEITIDHWTEAFSRVDKSYLKDRYATILAEKFSDEEIDALIEIAKIPVMKKYNSLVIEMTEANMEAGKDWAERVKGDLAMELEDILYRDDVDSHDVITFLKGDENV